jgi:tetratricopeptide (TPR) repeat protein
LAGAPESFSPSQSLSQANAALQAGEADKALALLAPLTNSGVAADDAASHNLACRVKFTLRQWDGGVTECGQAVRLEPQSSDFHMWLGRVLGEKAANASFLSAFSLAKQTRAEFEESVRLDPRNAAALADLGDFYSQAPGVVGGGIDKAQQIAAQLEKVDAARSHHLRGEIAGGQKDYGTAEREFKLAIAVSPHPALEWTGLARFYAHGKRYAEMDAAIQNARALALRDKLAAVALYDAAGLLIKAEREPEMAAALLEDYLASLNKTEEAPAFVAHLRLARVKTKLGDFASANRERSAALAMAREYKPANDFNPSESGTQESRF